MNDDDLVRQLREGDPSAAAFLVSLYASKMFGYARAIGPDLSDTDRQYICDIAVETAVRRIDRFDGSRGSLERWIRPFVRHAVQDWRRSHDQLAELPDGLENPTHDDADPMRQRALEHVVRAVASLSATDQLIIGLRDQEGLTYVEIAGRLGVHESACRQRHLRAIRRLAFLVQSDDAVRAILRKTSREQTR